MLGHFHPLLQEVCVMSARFRFLRRLHLPRRLLFAVGVCGAAWLFSATPLFAQSGMCASGGTGSTGSTGATGSTGGTTTTGTSSTGRTGTTAAASSATNAINLLQMAHQFTQMQAQAEQAHAMHMMQLLYMEGEMLRLEQQQVEQEWLARRAIVQKRREVQAAKVQQRKSGKHGPRPETRVSVAFQET
jgi:hypothetical protein